MKKINETSYFIWVGHVRVCDALTRSWRVWEVLDLKKDLYEEKQSWSSCSFWLSASLQRIIETRISIWVSGCTDSRSWMIWSAIPPPCLFLHSLTMRNASWNKDRYSVHSLPWNESATICLTVKDLRITVRSSFWSHVKWPVPFTAEAAFVPEV